MPAPDSLAFDDIVIDFTGRRLLRAGNVQALEPKAFAVLALLAGNPGHAFTRDEILDAVWGHRHITPGVLNRVMTLLRHALGEEAQSPRYLHTVHGVGYRLDLPLAAETPPNASSALADTPLPPDAPPVQHVEDGLPLPMPPRRRSDDPPQRRASDLGGQVLPQRRASDGRPPSRRWRVWSWRLLGALAVLALLGAALWRWGVRTPASAAAVPAAVSAPISTPAAEGSGIAVLPLVNTSADKEQQFFADGISENLINTLSSYEGLKVIGRSSSFRFRDSHEGSKSIGTALGVAYLLAGSVQRVGDHVRVGVELVNASDGRTLWTQQFNRPYRNLFVLQDDIALAVAGALQSKLPHIHGMAGAVESARPASGNLAAYSAFLRGSYFSLRDNRKAIEQFSEATRLDPGYAQAWQWQGFMRAISARFFWPDEATRRADCARARNEIETAIRLAPDYGLGYSALAVQMTSCDYDWNGALAQFGKALPLVPNTSPVHGQYSRLLASLGRVRQALDERRKYLDGDPLTVDGNYWQFLMEASLGRLEDAKNSLDNVVALDGAEEAPWYGDSQSYLALLRGDVKTALAQAQRIPSGNVRERALALALQAGDHHDDAEAALQMLIKHQGDNQFGPYYIARVYALRGDADAMFLWLQRDWQRRGIAAYQLLFDPLLLRFRNDPRFTAFCHTAGLPPPTASDALTIDQIRALNTERTP